MKKSVKNIVDIVAEHRLSIETYPNVVYVYKRSFPYTEEYVKLSDVGNDIKTAIELCVEKLLLTLKSRGISDVAA